MALFGIEVNFKDKIDGLIKIPAVEAVLRSADGPVFLVGGSVRDILSGRPLHDLDLIVTGSLEETAQKTARWLKIKAAPLGRPPLRVWRLYHQGLLLDLCPLAGPDIKTDLLRRDLTINALALRLTLEDEPVEIVDPSGGLGDLKEKRARFISEANVRDDPLRLLRLFRFMAVMDLSLDQTSLAMVKKLAPLITKMPGERVREEMIGLLSAPRSLAAVRLMLENGLLTELVPEIVPLKGLAQSDFHHLDVLEHTLLALARLEEIILDPGRRLPKWGQPMEDYLATAPRPALLKMAILFHDLGKAPTRTVDETGRVRFLGHDRAGEKFARDIARRFRMSITETQLISFIIRYHMRIFHLAESREKGQLTPKGIFRFGREAGEDIWALVLHTLADAEATRGPANLKKGGSSALIDFLDFLLARLCQYQAWLKKVPGLVSGHDIMTELGLGPSPLIGKILRAIEEAVAVGQVKNRTEAMELARKMSTSPGLKK